MPSLFRATISIYQPQWEYHKQNPGRLSKICQKAIDREMTFESMPDSLRDVAFDETGKNFFNRYDLQGDYAIENNSLIKHEATEEQISKDAQCFGIDSSKLIPFLDDLYNLEMEFALCRFALLNRGQRASLSSPP
jgi:hypothetical protein